VLHKSNQRQFLRAIIRSNSRNYVSCGTINNQSNFTFVFGHLAEVNRFWNEHVLEPIDKQCFNDESLSGVCMV
jgi:hypothetical protein